MTERNHDDLIEHLCRNRALNRLEAEQLINEVVTYFQEPPDNFIRRRHRELQLQGQNNSAIFANLKTELQQRLFPAAIYSERQIRRIVYG